MKALLLVSFGTRVNEARKNTIDRLVLEAREAFCDHSVSLAFTSGVIIKILRERDGVRIPAVEEALDLLVKMGVTDLVIQPTHLIGGIENEKMLAQAGKFCGQFRTVKVGRPLLETREDRAEVIRRTAAQMPRLHKDEAWVFMGHGSGHPANDIYIEMNELFAEMGFPHTFVATVEGQPSVEQAVKWALSGGYKKVYLAPLMLVAGDHARNDMAGADRDSWKNRFEAAGIETSCVMRGLGEYEGIRALYLEHARQAVEL